MSDPLDEGQRIACNAPGPVEATLASHKNAVANVSQTKIQYGGRTTG